MSEFELKINPENISEELATHADKFAYVAEKAINAELDFAEFGMKLDLLYVANGLLVWSGPPR
jgi:hypothetical protein